MTRDICACLAIDLDNILTKNYTNVELVPHCRGDPPAPGPGNKTTGPGGKDDRACTPAVSSLRRLAPGGGSDPIFGRRRRGGADPHRPRRHRDGRIAPLPGRAPPCPGERGGPPERTED